MEAKCAQWAEYTNKPLVLDEGQMCPKDLMCARDQMYAVGQICTVQWAKCTKKPNVFNGPYMRS